MTKDKALKLALEALERLALPKNVDDIFRRATVAIKEALAQPEQEPDDLTIAYMSGLHDGMKQKRALWELSRLGQEIEAHPEERNFCPRCGKRTADLTLVHTCTPPIAADPKAFHGFPSGSVSTPNAGGKCVTAGETAPVRQIDPNAWAFDRGLEST